MGESIIFRIWYYLREGWTNYAAFALAAINTITVTYFLAIEKFVFLKGIFPTMINYAIIITTVAVPIMILIGYLHWKTAIRAAEIDINYETNPYPIRALINTELLLRMNLKLENILKRVNNVKLDEKDNQESKILQDELNEFVNNRKFRNKDDWNYFTKIDRKKD